MLSLLYNEGMRNDGIGIDLSRVKEKQGETDDDDSANQTKGQKDPRETQKTSGPPTHRVLTLLMGA